MKRSLVPSLLALAVLIAAAAPPASAGPASDWPAYLNNARHTSTSASVAITPANAGTLAKAWTFTAAGPTIAGQPGKGFVASPIVYGGRIYIGSNTGVFYALNEFSGAIAWSRFLGFVPKLTCNARGIASTATVAIDPVTQKPTVYVSSGDGYLFALDAATGGVVWKREIHVQSPGLNDYFDWSSPTVANRSVYVGVSSQCDMPLVRAGVKRFDQATGAPQAEHFSVPGGEVGGSVWSSVAVKARAVYATTGNAHAVLDADAYSIVKLNPTTLARVAAYTVPGADRVPDSDFGASPVMFTGGGVALVGACNKGGYFYAVRATDMSFRWKLKLGQGSESGTMSCLAAGVWDGSRLFLSGPLTQIGSVDYRGSVRRVDPATGKPVWETGLPGVVIGTPSINGSGVIAAPIFEFDAALSGTYLLNAATGGIVRFLPGGTQFAQPSFAGTYLFTAAQTGGILTAWKLP
jgi:polyvinyl alcohol dehydrogenase (cytochrome)